MKNRRRYPRLKSHLIAGFRRVDSFKTPDGGTTGNVGIGGFMVEVEYPCPPLVMGQAMEITIRNPREKEEPIRGFGRIVWMQEKKDRSGCEVGIMFTYIRAEDKARYIRYFFEKTPA